MFDNDYYSPYNKYENNYINTSKERDLMSIYSNMNSKTLKEYQNKFKRVAENMRSGLFKHNDVNQTVDHFNCDVNKAVDNIILELENEICSRNHC